MHSPEPKGSIFSQRHDRIAFVAYFLGAVVPLAALLVVVQQFGLPAVEDTYSAIGLIALVASVALLSLSSFFVLRTTTRRSLAQMDSDNHRLGALLSASSELAAVTNPGEALSMATRCGLELCGAHAAYVIRLEETGKVDLAASSGREAVILFDEIHAKIGELIELVASESRPAVDGSTLGNGLRGAAAVPLPADDGIHGVLLVVQSESAPALGTPELDALTTLGTLTGVALSNVDLRDAQRNFFTHTTDLLVTAVDAHLATQTGHGARTAQIANRLARQLDVDEADRQDIHFAAQLHDVGMLRFDRSLVSNPHACEKHTTFGHRMLNQIKLWEHLAPLVHSHHEWWDGSGYPEGIEGETIPLGARIIAISDAFDAMVSNSSYQVAMPLEDAVKEINDGSGSQFDPDVVEAFNALIEQNAIGAD